MIFIILCLFVLGSNVFCFEEEEKQHNLYKKEHQDYIKSYEKAMASYSKVNCTDCSCYIDVIHEDLKAFKGGIDKELIKNSQERGVKYQIINGEVYRSKDCMFPSRCEGVDYFLNLIKNEVPNIEMIINFHDWPQISKHFGKPFPTQEYYDIMYPAWSFWKGGPAIKLYPTGIGRWDLIRKNILENSKIAWDKKKDKGFFRGSRTSNERDNLILLSRSEPDLVDASYTKNQAWKSNNDTLNQPPADEVSLEDHCKYRYLFNFRGVAASFRFKFLFLCKSVVLHVGDEWNEFFYSNLKPWVHYIPIESNSSIKNYRTILNFLKEEQNLAKKIANRGFNFIKNNLKMDHIVCYWKKLLLAYHKLLKYQVKLDKNLIKINL